MLIRSYPLVNQGNSASHHQRREQPPERSMQALGARDLVYAHQPLRTIRYYVASHSIRYASITIPKEAVFAIMSSKVARSEEFDHRSRPRILVVQLRQC